MSRGAAALLLVVGCAAEPTNDPRSQGEVTVPDNRTTAAPVAEITGEPSTAESTWPDLGARADACAKSPPGKDAPLETTIAALAKSGPKPGIYRATAHVTMIGKTWVVLSDEQYAGVKQPLTPTLDVSVRVADPSAFELFGQYEITLEVCPGDAPNPARIAGPIKRLK